MTPHPDPEKLRVAIAEALGWRRIGRCTRLMVPPHRFGRMKACPDYPNDPAAALTLCEWMAKEKDVWWEVGNDSSSGEQLFYCEIIFKQHGNRPAREVAPTLPLAICLAFAAANNLSILA